MPMRFAGLNDQHVSLFRLLVAALPILHPSRLDFIIRLSQLFIFPCSRTEKKLAFVAICHSLFFMSTSIRLSDEVVRQAKVASAKFQRSPPQQIEHWAQIGRAMEKALSYPSQEAACAWGREDDIDALITEVDSAEGKRKAQDIIQNNSEGLFVADPKNQYKAVRHKRPKA